MYQHGREIGHISGDPNSGIIDLEQIQKISPCRYTKYEGGKWFEQGTSHTGTEIEFKDGCTIQLIEPYKEFVQKYTKLTGNKIHS